MIGIINYGLGNIFSVIKAFNRLGIETRIVSSNEEILAADKLILPGVGHFAAGMEKLRELKLIEPLRRRVIDENIPILGICLGMQLMTEKSEEGGGDGLGWFKAETIKFPENKLKVPHMGWNTVKNISDNPLLKGLPAEAEFYFAHSFYVLPADKNEIIGETDYGIIFCSAISKKNIFGVQFHPEKSHQSGLKLLKNFSDLK